MGSNAIQIGVFLALTALIALPLVVEFPGVIAWKLHGDIDDQTDPHCARANPIGRIRMGARNP